MTRLSLSLALSLLLSGVSARAAEPTYDLVVYGATASGVMTAYSAAQQGLHVLLLEPGGHVGGMVTGGLSATDLGHFQIIGGYARNFYLEVAQHYHYRDLSKREHWLSEPHVDEQVFLEWLRKSHVDLKLHERLREQKGVLKQDTHLQSLITEDGKRWSGKVFADCSYEGDLMAQAKVSYVVGRESTAEYGEDLAGVRETTPKHQFQWPVSAYDADRHLIPEVSAGPLAPAGSADAKVQAYNFRLILTNDPKNRLPWTRPAGYDPKPFRLLQQYLADFETHMKRPAILHDVMNPVEIPNHKADFNNNGPFSTDYIGRSWKYPDAGYLERDHLWREHLLYTKSFLYFLSQDPSVPATLRQEVNQWGLAEDEFQDTEHWPSQLYIREGRRMRGIYVMHQADLQTDRIKADSIGMGSYNSDSHNVQRVAMPDGSVRNEGDVQVPVQPYEIAYRSIVPKATEAENLLVPVCLSASHVAYSSVRMEPQYMIVGQAAGVAAALAVKHSTSVQKVAVAELQERLRAAGAILHIDQAAQ